MKIESKKFQSFSPSIQRSNIGRQITRGIRDNVFQQHPRITNAILSLFSFFFFFLLELSIDEILDRMRMAIVDVNGSRSRETGRLSRAPSQPSTSNEWSQKVFVVSFCVRLRSQVRSCSLPSRLTALIYLFATRFIVEQFSYIIRT